MSVSPTDLVAGQPRRLGWPRRGSEAGCFAGFLLVVWVRGGGGGGLWCGGGLLGSLRCAAAAARAARGQNAVGSCVHSAANYTHRETIWQSGRRCHGQRMNAAREAKEYTETEPNYIDLYLLPGATAASQRPRVKGG